MTLDEILAELAQCQPLCRPSQTTKGREMTMDDHNTANNLRRIIGDTITELGRVKAQRDELVEALRRIHDGDVMHGKSLFTHADVVEAYQTIARRALAKLDKEEQQK